MAVTRLARTSRLYMSESECHTLCKLNNNNLMDEIYNFKDKHLKEYERRRKIYSKTKNEKKNNKQTTTKRHRIVIQSPQRKFERGKTTSCSALIFHLAHFENPNTFAKTYSKFMILIYKLMRGNLDTIFDLN